MHLALPTHAASGVLPLIGEQIEIQGTTYQVEALLGSGGYGTAFRMKALDRPDLFLVAKFLFYTHDPITNLATRRKILKAASLPSKLHDGDRSLLFTPTLLKVDLNPNRPKEAAEAGVLYAHPDRDYVIISPLAKSDLDKIIETTTVGRDRIVLAKKVLNDLLPELALIAKNGYVHADIKPSNVLLSQEGRFGLNDFDTMTPIGEHISLWTPNFAPPEHNTYSYFANPTYDLYSLGRTLIKVLSQKPLPGKRDIDSQSTLKSLQSEYQMIAVGTDSNLAPVIEEIFIFLNAVLREKPAERFIEFSKTRFSQQLKRGRDTLSFGPLSPSRLAPEVQNFKTLANQYADDTDSEDEFAKKLKEIDNVQSVIKKTLQDKSLAPQAYRAAQVLGLPLEPFNEDLADSILKVGATDKNWFGLMDTILSKPLPAAEPVADALLKRFILPVNSLALTKSFYEFVSQYPSLIKKHENLLLERLQNLRKMDSFFNYSIFSLSLLFLEYEPAPREVKEVWLEALATDMPLTQEIKSKIVSKLSQKGPESEWYLRYVVDHVHLSPDDKSQLLVKLSRLLEYKIPATDMKWALQILLSPENELHSTKLKLILAQMLLRNGYKPLPLIQYFLRNTSRISFEAFEPQSLKFNLESQLWIATFMKKSKDRDEIFNAYVLLSNQERLHESTIEYLFKNQSDSYFLTEYYIARLLAQNQHVDLGRAAHILLQSLDDDSFDQASSLKILGELLPRIRMNDSLAIHLRHKQKKFAKAFESNGIHVQKLTVGYDHINSSVDVLSTLADQITTRNQVHIVLSELEREESGTVFRALAMLKKVSTDLIDSTRLEKIVKTKPKTRSAFYAAALLHERFRLWSLDIETVYLFNSFQISLPDAQYSRSAITSALNQLKDATRMKKEADLSSIKILGSSKLLPIDLEALRTLQNRDDQSEMVNRILQLQEELSKPSPVLSPTQKADSDFAGMTTDKLFEILESGSPATDVFKILKGRELSQLHSQRLERLMSHSDRDVRIAAAALRFLRGAWDSSIQKVYFDAIVFGSKRWNVDAFKKPFFTKALQIPEIESLFQQSVAIPHFAKFYELIKFTLQSPTLGKGVNTMLTQYRNSKDPNAKLLAALTLHLAGFKEEINRHIILEYGINQINPAWMEATFPPDNFTPQDLHSLVKGLMLVPADSHAVAISLLKAIPNALLIQSPEMRSLLTAPNESIKNYVAFQLLNNSSASDDVITFALEAVVNGKWTAKSVIDVMAAYPFPLARRHYDWLVNDFLNLNSPTRPFSYSVLRLRLPLPQDLALKIESRHSGQHHLEVLGSKLKQPTSGISCLQVTLKAVGK